VDDQANTEDTQGGNTTVQPSAGTQTPKPLDAALFGTPTTQGSVSAYHPVADVKVVTDVNPPPSPGVTPSDGTARIREAMASVANQAVIRGASTGTVDVPELGRVAVHARSEAGAIDVSVTVAHSAAQQVLQAHAAGIVGDLRHAALPISRMSVEQSSTSGSAFGSTTSQGDRQAFSNQTPQRERPATVLAEEQPLPIATMPGRVRIVL
jgi:flagellar hook-length control protein FliK